MLLAVSTRLGDRPSATASQVSAKAIRTQQRRARRASRAAPASGGSPMQHATTPPRRPGEQGLDDGAEHVAGEHRERAMAMVRNRAMMPSVMSVATEIAVPAATPATVMSRMPGAT